MTRCNPAWSKLEPPLPGITTENRRPINNAEIANTSQVSGPATATSNRARPSARSDLILINARKVSSVKLHHVAERFMPCNGQHRRQPRLQRGERLRRSVGFFGTGRRLLWDSARRWWAEPFS